MRNALEEEYGVAVRWADARSTNTRENARESAALLRADGITRVVLVAHAIDMPRALREFGAVGIVARPAATGIPASGPLAPMDFVPSAAALQASHDALYEWLANLAGWAAGLVGVSGFEPPASTSRT